MLMADYATFLLEARKNLKLYEEAVIKRDFNKAYEHALNTFAEVRLLMQIAKDSKDVKEG
jgi:hypothetical protein